MLTEAIKHLQDTAMEPCATFIPDPSDQHKTLQLTPDGLVTIIDNRPMDRWLEVGDLGTLLELAVGAAEGLDLDGKKTEDDTIRPAIFISRTRVELRFDVLNSRRTHELAVMPLNCTEEWDFFVKRRTDSGALTLSPEHFIDALRFILPKAAPSGLLDTVRTVDFTMRTQASQDKGRSKESLGSSVIREVTPDTAVSLPEDMQVFHPRMWKSQELYFRPPLECILDPDLQRNGWTLFPLEESIHGFIHASFNWLRQKVFDDTGGKLPVYLSTFQRPPAPRG